VTRLRLDANLFAFPPPKRKGRGRPLSKALERACRHSPRPADLLAALSGKYSVWPNQPSRRGRDRHGPLVSRRCDPGADPLARRPRSLRAAPPQAFLATISRPIQATSSPGLSASVTHQGRRWCAWPRGSGLGYSARPVRMGCPHCLTYDHSGATPGPTGRRKADDCLGERLTSPHVRLALPSCRADAITEIPPCRSLVRSRRAKGYGEAPCPARRCP
jgi:hypothetical protein